MRWMFWILALVVIFEGRASHALAASDGPAAALQATLVVRSARNDDRFLGSAFVIGSPRTAVTNAHVIGSRQQVMVVDFRGNRQIAQVVARDEKRDLAVLALTQDAARVLSPAVGRVLAGQPVYASGAPLEAAFSLTAGIVSTPARQIDPREPVLYIQHSAPINPGSSGGPLVDGQGRVIGINTRISDGSRFFVGIAYAVPVADVLALLNGAEPVARPGPGMQVRALSRQIRAALGYDAPGGVLVDHVAPGQPAARAGLHAGDILVSMGNHTLRQPGDIALALVDLPAHSQMRVIRAGQPLVLDLHLQAGAQPITPMTGGDVAARASYGMADMGITVQGDGLITDMAQEGAGFFAGLSAGDTIIALNGQAIDTLAADWPDTLALRAPALLLIRLADGSTRHYMLDPWADTQRLRPVGGANILDPSVVMFD